MSLTIAIGVDKTVQLWCNVNKRTENMVWFYVINGAWEGRLDLKTSLIYVEKSRKPLRLPFYILWEGEVPFPFKLDYNQAMGWIEGELS